MKITEIKTCVFLLNDLMFYDIYRDISARFLLISKFIKLLKSSRKDKSFGTRIITLGQCVNEL